MTLGSSSAIFAHNISLLGSRVGFTSCIGGDPLGKFCVDRLVESGVDVSGVKCLPDKTTGVTVILPLAKNRQILTRSEERRVGKESKRPRADAQDRGNRER